MASSIVERFSPHERSLLALGKKPLRDRSADERTAVVVTGPPGSGKSTLVSSLIKERTTASITAYIEESQKNPFLRGGVVRNPMNAPQSQEWFLRQYDRSIREIGAERLFVVDQDPRAVVLVYSRRLAAVGSISKTNYSRQINRCRNIFASLSENFGNFYFVSLVADSVTRLYRLKMREPASCFNERFYQEVGLYFEFFLSHLRRLHQGRYIEYDTGKLAVAQIQSDLIERLTADGNNIS